MTVELKSLRHGLAEVAVVEEPAGQLVVVDGGGASFAAAHLDDGVAAEEVSSLVACTLEAGVYFNVSFSSATKMARD